MWTLPRSQQGYNQQAAWLLVGFFWGNLYVEESQITWYAFSFVEYIFLCLCVFSNLQEYTNWWVCGWVTNVPPAPFHLWQNMPNIYLCVCVFSNLREHTNWWVCSKVTNLPPAAFRLCSEDKIVVNFLPHPPTHPPPGSITYSFVIFDFMIKQQSIFIFSGINVFNSANTRNAAISSI